MYANETSNANEGSIECRFRVIVVFLTSEDLFCPFPGL
jgi:hypothetical protein